MVIKDYTSLHWTFSSNSSGGTYLKSEKIIGGKKYYFKLSDFSYGRFVSHEAVLEVIASRLGEKLGLPVLKYTGTMAKIVIDNKCYITYVTKSENYCKNGETAVPLLTEFQLNRLNNESPIDFCRRIGLTEYIDYIIIFDYLIANTDRHGRNIELLIDEKTIKPSPIFDNGRCLTSPQGNIIENILKFNYKSEIMANNFVGGIYLEKNLRYVSKSYKLNRLTPEILKSVFYGMTEILGKQHVEFLKQAILYRYNVLLKKGVIS